MFISAIWFIGVAATAVVIDHRKETECEKLTNLDCFIVLAAWPYVLVKELMKWRSN